MKNKLLDHGFRSYILNKYDSLGFKPTLFYFKKLLLVSPTLVWEILSDAFIEIALVVVFLFIVTGMSQGRDLVVSFFEPHGLFGFWRLIFTTLTIINYSVCMWLIPAFLFEMRDRRNGTTGDEAILEKSYFSTHLFFAHRVLPLLPFWIFSYATQHSNGMHVLIVAGAITELLALNFLYNWRREWIKTVSKLTVILVVVFLVLVRVNFHNEYSLVKALYTCLLFIISFGLYIGANKCDEQLLTQKTNGKEGIFKKYKVNTFIYFFVFAIQALGMFFCIYIFDLKAVVPESVLLFIFSFYVFAIDFLFYLASLSVKWKTRLTFAAVALFILFVAGKLSNYRHYNIRYAVKREQYIRDSMPDIKMYYNNWKQRILNRRDKSAPYSIVLVSGEGGGSRAGLWFSQSIINMDVHSGGKLKDHIFSMSTVSGSSVGLGALVSYWTYCKQHNISTADPKWVGYPANIFKYNFVGGSILGLAVTDFVNSFFPLIPWTPNRNEELQNEEAACIQRAMIQSATGVPQEDFNLFKKGAGFDPDSLVMNRDFLSFYYEKMTNDEVNIKTDLPLSFINTCRSNDGRRGIFAPVRLDTVDFLDAIDMCQYIYTPNFKSGGKNVNGLSKSISIGTACNTSELFPLFSAPALVKGLGYFVDGGYHENSGLKTTLEIYDKLKTLLKNDSLIISDRDYVISVLYLKNGKYEKKYYPDTFSPTIPGLQPIVAISNVPFSGNASYFEENASHRLKDQFIRFQLNYSNLLDSSIKQNYYTDVSRKVQDEMLADIYDEPLKGRDTVLNFPLARWLSSYIIERIQNSYILEYNQEKNLRNLVERIKQE